VVRADHSPQVFGIKLGREGGRANQIGEHHRELPPFGDILGLRFRFGRERWRRSHCFAQLADGREHLPPMSERNAHVLEVLIGQMA
jgi:hypothetical protein